MALIQVSTVRQTLTPEQKLTSWVVVAGTRQSKNKEAIPEDQRVRSIITPLPDVSSVPSKFSVFVSGCLMDVAKAQLAAIWQETPTVKEVESSLFTTDGLLAFASREAESKRLTGASVKLAVAEFIKTVAAAKQEEALFILMNMAAASKKATEKQCLALQPKFVAWVKKQDEDQNPVVHLVAEKLAEHIEAKRIERLAFDMEEESTF